MKRIRRVIALLMIIVLIPALMSCYGAFPLTHGVYGFNGRIGGDSHSSRKIVPQIVFWIFVILPVYHIAMLGDAFIFNLIEFWTGDTMNISYTFEQDGKTVSLVPVENGKALEMTLSQNGNILSQERFVKVSESTFEVRKMDGTVVGTVVKAPDGTINLQDSQGKNITQIRLQDIAGSSSHMMNI